MSVRISTAIALTLTLGAPGVVLGDSLRCGKWVVTEDATPAEIRQKCGAPQEEQRTDEDVFGRNPAGYRIKTGTTTIEQWYYQRGSQSFRMRVTIVDGDVRHIERAPG